MKKRIKTALCLLLALCTAAVCATTFFAETIFISGDFGYTLLDDNYISLYSWSGTDALDVPSTLDSYRVREIRNSCFNSRSDFTAVNFDGADHLTRIGYNAFKNTAISGTLSIPPQVRTVGTSAFQNCDSIEILYYNAMSAVISAQCFYDCDALREVYLTDGITTIESHAFSDCDGLEIVRIPDTVTSIAPTAFNNCPSLTIYCYYNSYAAQYAADQGVSYVIINPPEPPTEPVTEPVTEPETEPATEPATEPVTQPATEPATEPKSYYLLGDVDGDGIVDITDVTFIRRDDISLPVPDEYIMLHGDVDGDNVVSVMDATAIMRWNIGLYVPYTIGERVYID